MSLRKHHSVKTYIGIATTIIIAAAIFITLAAVYSKGQEFQSAESLNLDLTNIEIVDECFKVEGNVSYVGNTQWSAWCNKTIWLHDVDTNKEYCYLASDVDRSSDKDLAKAGAQRYCGFNCEIGIDELPRGCFEVYIGYQYNGSIYTASTGWILQTLDGFSLISQEETE